VNHRIPHTFPPNRCRSNVPPQLPRLRGYRQNGKVVRAFFLVGKGFNATNLHRKPTHSMVVCGFTFVREQARPKIDVSVLQVRRNTGCLFCGHPSRHDAVSGITAPRTLQLGSPQLAGSRTVCLPTPPPCRYPIRVLHDTSPIILTAGHI
jgi:hypothetical protein